MEHPAGLAGTEATRHSEQSMDVLELGQLSVSDEGQHEAFLKPNPVNSEVIKSSKQVFKLLTCNKYVKSIIEIKGHLSQVIPIQYLKKKMARTVVIYQIRIFFTKGDPN